MKVQGHIPAASPIGAHEGADLDVPLITRIAVILAATLVALVLLTLLVFHLYEKQYPHRTSEAAPIVTFASLPPAPRLQATPRKDWRQVHAEEEAHLEVYGWVDGSHTMARIPIERAMTRWVELQNAAAATWPTTNAPAGAMPLNPLLVAPAGNAPASTQPAKKSATTQAPVLAPTAGVTELQMRQEKAKEAAHAH